MNKTIFITGASSGSGKAIAKLFRSRGRSGGLTPPAVITEEVVYEAATDGKDQLTYIAGEQAKNSCNFRQKISAENFRLLAGNLFSGRPVL